MGAHGDAFSQQSGGGAGQQLFAESRPQVSAIGILVCSDIVAIVACVGLTRIVVGTPDFYTSAQLLVASLSYLMGLALLGVYPGRGMWGPERVRRRCVMLMIAFAAPIIVSLFLQPRNLLNNIFECAMTGTLLFFFSCFLELLAISIADRIGTWRARAVFIGDTDLERRVRFDLNIYPELGLDLVPTDGGLVQAGIGSVGSYFGLRHVEPFVFDPSSPLPGYYSLRRPGGNLHQAGTWAIARAIKRGLDIIGALMGAVFLLPALVVAGLSIYLIDGAPIFYVQKRGGLGDKVIFVLKFRSMYRDADSRLDALLASDPQAVAEWERHFKLQNDPRVLPSIGNFVRRCSIDELPQLWNVLKGDMSLVGPRPFPEQHLAIFSSEFRNLRATFPPGLSGLWQVTLRSDGEIKDQETLDRVYIECWSIWLDLYILFRTPIALFTGTGAR